MNGTRRMGTWAVALVVALVAGSLYPSQASGQMQVVFEDFEDATVGYTPSIGEASDDDSDYFARMYGVGGRTHHAAIAFTNKQGTGYFAAQDMDANGTGDPNAPGAMATLTWSGLDVSGLANLQFSAFFAEDNATDGAEDWDAADDYVLVEARLDGGAWQPVFRIENDGTIYNTAPREDTDFNGIGDGAEITDTFTLFTKPISGTGASLDLRITLDLDAGDEDIAFDNVRVTGELAGGVQNPSGFAAVAAATNRIELAWALNGSGDSVVVAWSGTGAFGAPETGVSYLAGDPIPGGGVVLYAGAGTGAVHGGLMPGSEYFYRAWSFDGAHKYSPGVGASAATPGDGTGFRILHWNDAHSRLHPHDLDLPGTNDAPILETVGGAGRFTANLLRLKSAQPNSLVLDAGDMSEGNPLGDLDFDGTGTTDGNGGMIRFYNLLDQKLKALGGRGIDAAVVGNHDVRFLDMVHNMKQNATFPFISMNVLDKQTGLPYFDPYRIVVVNGVKIGILGYTNDKSSYLEDTSNTVRVAVCAWDEPAAELSIKEAVEELRVVQHCDVVVLLAHMGQSRVFTDNPDDHQYQLVKDDGVTAPPEVVVSGHWHSWDPTVWQPAPLNHKTICAEAGAYLQCVGEVVLDDAGGYVHAQKHMVLHGAGAPPADPEVEALIATLTAEYSAAGPVYALDQVIGYSAADLRLNKNKWWTLNEYPWAGDNTAGAWVADSMRWKALSLGHACDIALQSGGGIRRDNAAGPITYREIYETYPWRDDTMMRIEARGREVWDFIENSYVGASISAGWQVIAEDGHIVDILVNGASINPTGTYSVVLSDYMLTHENDKVGGGWSDPTPTEIPYSIRQAMVDYTAQFTAQNPMTVAQPRYMLDTTLAGRFRAVVTMIDDVESSPVYESLFVRLLDATPDTVANRGRYVPMDLVHEDGSINRAHQFAETMLYRSYLGFDDGLLLPGDILEISVEGGFHAGNPQVVDQTGIVSNGVEFVFLGHDGSLAEPDPMPHLAAFWDEWHENHYVSVEVERVSTNRVRDRLGVVITVYGPGAYTTAVLPGNNGDLLQLVGCQTYRYTERRFRCADAVVLAAGPGPHDYTPFSRVNPITPPVQGAAPLLLTAMASDATEDTVSLLPPVADAYVGEGRPTSNYGASTTLYLQSASAATNTYQDQRIWTRFDLSGLPGGLTITSARLQMYCFREDATLSLAADCHASTNDAWAENGLTWNLQPAFDPTPADAVILDESEEYLWYAWDVTPEAAADYAGDGLVSLVVKPQVENAEPAHLFRFDSKEYGAGALGPFLEVQYTGAPVTGGTVVNTALFYRYSPDNRNWGAWTFVSNDPAAPWAWSFSYPNGGGYYEFHTRATDNTGHLEPAPALADAAVQYAPSASLAITTPDSVLSPVTSTFLLEGTYDGIPGAIGWSNSLSGTTGVATKGDGVWSALVPVIGFASGANVLVVSASSEAGPLTDSVTLLRDGPRADLKANGSDDPIAVSTNDLLTLQVSLTPGAYAGAYADWWLLAETPAGWYYYHVYAGVWTPGLIVSLQSPLVNVPPTVVLEAKPPVPGTYRFYFGADCPMNGVLDPELLFYDIAEVNVAP